jgi:hypothetical protein
MKVARTNTNRKFGFVMTVTINEWRKNMSKAPDLYRIKYRKGTGNWKYGICYTFSMDEEEQRAWDERRLLRVEDAILPVAEWVSYDHDNVTPIEFSFDPDNPDEYDAYVQKEFEKAEAKSAKATGLTGKLFSVGVADGCAYYVIVKENKKTVKVEWRGYLNGDRYTDTMMQWGGTVSKDRVEDIIRWQEGLRALSA